MRALESAANLIEIPIHKIIANPHQPRRQFSEEELQELADSIKKVGIIHPPLVQNDPEKDQYILVAGERRWRAAQLAGLKTITVLVRQDDSAYSAHAALIENIQRVDLNPIDVATALKKLMLEHRYNQEELAQMLGKKRSTVANYLRLLTLPQNIQASTVLGTITMGHAKAILSLDDVAQQQLLHELVIRDGLSVRQAEETALRLAEKVKKKQLKFRNRDFFLEHLARQIEEKLGTKVMISSQGKKGRISIDYHSLDDLDRLLALFGINN